MSSYRKGGTYKVMKGVTLNWTGVTGVKSILGIMENCTETSHAQNCIHLIVSTICIL